MDQIRKFVCLFVAIGLLLVLSQGALAYDQLLAPEVEMGDLDYFGYSVAVDGNLAVVGAPAFAGGSIEPSRAYVFEKTASGWAVLTRLQPSVDANDEYYGSAVAISGDTIIVGAHDTDVTIEDVTYARAGAVYIYTYDGVGGWNVQKIVAPDPGGAELFGSSVDIDGDIVIIGTPRWREGTLDHIQGAAYVYSRNAGGPGIWGFVKKIIGPEPINYMFGEAVSVSGSTVAIGAPGWYDDSHVTGTGAVYLYERDLGGVDNWGERKRIAPDNELNYLQFGHAVSLDADTLAVGTYGLPEAYIYERDLNGDNNWGHRTTLVPEDSPGNTYGTALSLDGDLLTVGAYLDATVFSGSGSVYFYFRDQDGTNAWGLVAKQLHPAPDVNDNQRFGYSVSLCTNTILVGADGDDFLDNNSAGDDRGAAYILVLCDQLGGDIDEDDICGDFDNCPEDANPKQFDLDEDGIGNVCDSDADGDGEMNDTDCNDLAPAINSNADEICDDGTDNDCDGATDLEDNDCVICLDNDGDGICNWDDNCPDDANHDQADDDGDGIGNACDTCSNDPDNDTDGDGICGDVDNCRDVANQDQLDSDGDGIGDACEEVILDLAIVQLRAPNKAKSCLRDKDVIIVVQNNGTEQTIGTTTLTKDGQIVASWEASNFSTDKSGKATIEYIYSPAEDSGLVSWEACVSTPYDIDPGNNCMTDSSEIIPCN